MKVLLGMVLSLGLAGIASADSVWTYTGNIMDGSSYQLGKLADCGCALSGTVTLDSNYSPESWSFTDGTHTLDNSDSTISLNPFYFGSAGINPPFLRWNLDVTGLGIQFHSAKYIDPTYYVDFSAVSGVLFGHNAENAGTWVDPVPSAEPATGLLVGLSLAIAGLVRRRKKKPLQSTVWENLA